WQFEWWAAMPTFASPTSNAIPGARRGRTHRAPRVGGSMSGLRTSLHVEELGDRTLPSGFGFWHGHGFGFGFGFGANLSPTVQADIAQLRTDQQQLQTDLVALGPTLQADQQALQTAIQNAFANNTDVQAAKTTLTNDRATWRATIQADWQAIVA